MTTNYNLSGKNILISGASSGIGKQTAINLSKAGARVFITGRTPEKLNETYRNLIGEKHVKIVADLTEVRQIDEVISAVTELHGFVHCAGISTMIPVKYIKQEQIREVFSLNYESAVLLVSKALSQRKISKNASFVFISSLATINPLFGGSLYIGSKLALEGFSKTIAIELTSKGIRSNCICPAYVFSPMIDKAKETMSAAFIEKFKAMHPNGFGYPQDVANIIAFLLSEESQWVNGQNINLGSFNINIPLL
ncbi:MAG: SDR family oxidoreductase [Bacteroidales bacterium]|jgi:NAD(P)-dependent dehydrogenase (short-subunit alcohol dehydrogenase family)